MIEVNFFTILFFGALGLVIGSFLTACIYRIPFGREKGPGRFGMSDEELSELEESEEEEHLEEQEFESMSLLSPARSLCPVCKAQLRWYHNVPFFSWVFLGGKCGFCKTSISVLYPFVELLTALCSILSFTLYPPLTALVVFLFSAALIVMSFIDMEYYILPDVINIPGIWISAALVVLNQFTGIFAPPIVHGALPAFYGFLAGAGFLFLVSEVYLRWRGRVGLGFGDVKLLAFIGVLFGPIASLYTIFIGSLLGSIIGGGMLLLQSQKFSRPLPFGPYLALGALLYVYTGPELLFVISATISRLILGLFGLAVP